MPFADTTGSARKSGRRMWQLETLFATAGLSVSPARSAGMSLPRRITTTTASRSTFAGYARHITPSTTSASEPSSGSVPVLAGHEGMTI